MKDVLAKAKKEKELPTRERIHRAIQDKREKENTAVAKRELERLTEGQEITGTNRVKSAPVGTKAAFREEVRVTEREARQAAVLAKHPDPRHRKNRQKWA